MNGRWIVCVEKARTMLLSHRWKIIWNYELIMYFKGLRISMICCEWKMHCFRGKIVGRTSNIRAISISHRRKIIWNTIWNYGLINVFILGVTSVFQNKTWSTYGKSYNYRKAPKYRNFLVFPPSRRFYHLIANSCGRKTDLNPDKHSILNFSTVVIQLRDDPKESTTLSRA